MANEKTNRPQSPEETAKAIQQEAMEQAMEQAQAMFGNIPGFQMPNLAEAQEQLMKDMGAIPGVAEAQAYQAEMMKQVGMDPEAMRQTYQQNLANAQQMMAQAMEGIPEGSYTGEEFLGLGSDADWVVTRKADGKLTPEQNRLLAFGAPLCVYNDDYVDSLESTTDAETLKEMLEEWWGVTDKKTVLEIIDWLLNEGQHANADLALTEIKKRGLDAITEEEKGDEDSKIGDAFTIAEFVTDVNESTVEELPGTVLGWDLVRAVNVARWAYLCDYINENEMWKKIEAIVDIAKKTFNSWEEYGLSFAVGRGVWRGDTDDYETADEVIAALSRQEESPWKEFEW